MAQVNQQSAAVARMAGDWAVIDALLGGTPAMRAAGVKYLPKQPREDQTDYDYRKGVATLFPAFERTVGVMAGKPFSKLLTIGDSVPERIKTLLPNIDNQGKSLHVLAAKAFAGLVSHGYGGILVDHTKSKAEVRTVADEKAAGARPFWVHYKHTDVLGLDWEEVADGWKLVRVRLREVRSESDGAYGRVDVEQIRVLEPGKWEIHRANAQGVWGVVEEGTTSLDFVPFVPLIADAINKEEGKPPLRNLAYLNVKHWQLQSDLDDSLRYAIKPIIAVTGLTDTSASITLQAGGMIKLPQGATLDVKQGQSEAVTVGRTEIAALEQQMIQTGAELLVATPGQRTATEASNDAEANKSQLQRLAEEFSDALALGLQYTAAWIGEPEGGTVTLFSDYAAGSLSDASAQMVKEMGQIGWITAERALKEMQRRGVLEANFDAASEVALAKEAAPRLGMTGVE